MRGSVAPFRYASSIVALVAAVASLSAASASADSFDWRTVNGSNWNSTVESQFGGTCWDFSSCGCIEAKYMLTRNDPSYLPDVSEQEVCWEQYMGSTGGGSGPAVLDYFTTHGVVSYSECPYVSSSPDTGVAPYWPLASGWQNRVWKSTSNYNDFTGGVGAATTAAMKTYLKLYGPLEVGCSASNDLYTSVSSVEANYRGPVSGEDHEVSLVGYVDDSKVPSGGYWIIKNSWGYSDNTYTDYGNNGYYLIPYGDIEVHSDISAITGAVYYTGAMASGTWTGGAGTWTKGSATKWNSGGYTWQNQETSALFAGTGGSVTLSGPVIAHSLTVNSTGYSFNGGSLTVTAGGIQANQSTTIGSAVYIGAPQSWTVAAGKTLTLNGPLHTIISNLTLNGAGNTVIGGLVDGGGVLNTVGGAAPGGLIQAGSGTVTLSGTQGVAADITVNAGAGPLNISPTGGASVAYSGGLFGGGTINVNCSGTFSLGGGASNFTGTLNMQQAGTLCFIPAAGVTNTLGGVITASGTILQNGPGATVLSGTLNLTGTRNLCVYNGTLSFGSRSEALDSFQITGGAVSGGTFTSTAGYDVQGGTINSVLAGGTASLSKTGAGTAILACGNTYGGSTTVSAGTLQIGGGSNSGSVPGNIVVASGGTLAVCRYDAVTYTNKISGAGTLLQSGAGTLTMSGGNVFSGNVAVSNGTLDYSGNATLPGGNYTVSGGVLNLGSLSNTIGALQLSGGTILGSGTLTSNAACSVSGGTIGVALAGSASLSKTGSGDAAVGNAAYTGTTSISNGSLTFNGALPKGNYVVSGGTLYTNAQSQSIGGFQVTGGMVVGSGTLTSSSAYDVQGGRVVVSLGGNVGLNKTGSGPAAVVNACYIGPTTVSAGSLTFYATLPGGNYTVSGGVLGTSGLSGPIGTFQITGGLASGTGTLTSNTTYDVRGGEVDVNLAGNSIGLTKSGSATAIVTGANSYIGRTTVTGGTLELGPKAQNCVFNGGGADVQSGVMIFNYAGAADPLATIENLLKASYDGGRWDIGQFRDSTAAASGLTLGCYDDTSAHEVKVTPTYPGDFNLDGVVNGLDQAIWLANAFTGTTWQQGDANYDGSVDGLDRDALLSHEGLPGLSGGLPAAPPGTVPEPGTLGLLVAGLLGLLVYSRRKQKWEQETDRSISLSTQVA